MSPTIKFTYFDLEAAGEPVRLALVLAKQPFEDVRVKFPDWPALKPTTPNGQLPIMTIDGGPAKTQSKAMTRWVGQTFSKTLYPADKVFEIEEAIGHIEDLQREWQPCLSLSMRPESLGYPAGFSKTDEGKALIQAMRERFVKEGLPNYMKRLTASIQSHGGKWLVAGEAPTVADCFAIPMLRAFTRGHIDHVATTCLDKYPVVVQYIKNFCALPEIQGRYTNGIF